MPKRRTVDEDSELGVTSSFLAADLSIVCDGSGEHARIKLLAYVFMVRIPYHTTPCHTTVQQMACPPGLSQAHAQLLA